MFPRKLPLRATQVKPKMAAVFRTLNSSDWLVYGLAFMFAARFLLRVTLSLARESWQSVCLRSQS